MIKYFYFETLFNQANNAEVVEVSVKSKKENNSEIMSYISKIYKKNYNADIKPQPDLIISTKRINGDAILACAGITIGNDNKQFFSEKYLKDESLYNILLKQHENIRSTEIIEIGSLASDSPKYASLIIKILPLLSWSMGFRVILCTTTKQLRTLFKYYKIPFNYICDSSVDVLSASEREKWGTYYENSPQVVSIHLDSCGHLFERYCGKLVPEEIGEMYKLSSNYEECA